MTAKPTKRQRDASEKVAPPLSATAGPADDGARPAVQVIARAASVLRALAGEVDGVTLGALATRVSLARSTVQRIVSALEAEQLVEVHAQASGARVCLGVGIRQLAASTQRDPVLVARPVMEALSHELGETVDLSQRAGKVALFLEQVPGNQRLQAVSSVGQQFPLHCTANGKALLSLLPDDEVGALLQCPLPRLTPRTLTRLEAVLAQVRDCRTTHVAFDLDEHTEGICAVGVAVRDATGRSLALSVPVPSARFERRRAVLTAAVLAAHDELCERLC